MNYSRLLRRIRQDERLFTTDDTHKIHRVLSKAHSRHVASLPKPDTMAQVLRANPHLCRTDFA